MSELEIHVLDSSMIVNLVGSRSTVTFENRSGVNELSENPFWTFIDPGAGISATELKSIANLRHRLKRSS